MLDSELLFHRFSIHDTLRQAKSGVLNEILEEKRDYLLNVVEEDYISHLVEKHSIEPLVLHRESITIAQQADEMIVVQDFGQAIQVRKNYVTFSIPFSGERELFFVCPSTHTSPPRAVVESSDILIKICNENDDGPKLRDELDSVLRTIEQYLGWQKNDIDVWNSGVRTHIESEFRSRKQKLLKEIGAVQSLGFPMRKRADMPTSYSVLITKKKIAFAKPSGTSTPYQAHPALEEAQYHEILDILRNMVLVMERSPTAFATMGEEDLRTHFLVQLNGQYEGGATAETFNYQGKTDILIRQDGKNLFVAECKFWGGAKMFAETIDQLLGYLTWRDAKVAALIFVRDVSMSTVLNQIPGLLSSHSSFLRVLPSRHAGEFAAIVKSKSDPLISLILTIQVYHIPK